MHTKMKQNIHKIISFSNNKLYVKYNYHIRWCRLIVCCRTEEEMPNLSRISITSPLEGKLNKVSDKTKNITWANEETQRLLAKGQYASLASVQSQEK